MTLQKWGHCPKERGRDPRSLLGGAALAAHHAAGLAQLGGVIPDRAQEKTVQGESMDPLQKDQQTIPGVGPRPLNLGYCPHFLRVRESTKTLLKKDQQKRNQTVF